MATDVWSGSRELRVACILLSQAREELKKDNSPLANEIFQFLQGVINKDKSE